MRSIAGLAELKEREKELEEPKHTTKQEAKKELKETLGESRDVLVEATTVFPLTLFPDTITVDKTKITVTHKNFFKAGEVLSIAIEDVLNITATVGPFFGRISLATRFFDPNKPYQVDHFWRDDALKVKRIVQGYLIAKQKDIDTTALSTQELARTLDELGQNTPEESI
jgi:hypothetical protein